MKKITLILILLLAYSFSYGQEIVSFSSLANNGCSGVVSNNSNISANGICRGIGLTINVGADYNSRNWTPTSTLNTDDYLEWSITANPGYEINLIDMDLRYDRSGTGPTMVDILVNTGSGFSSIFTDSSVSPGGENNNGIDLSSITNQKETITFRLYAFNSSGSSGTFDIEDRIAPDKGIIINGTVIAEAPCLSATTWNGSTWDNGNPSSTSVAILNGDYNTDPVINGSFSACSLVVNSGTLTIADDSYVEIQNDVTVNGAVLLSPYGEFVQVNDLAVVDGDVLTTPSKITVTKKTPPLNNWFEYTYWSSPVSGETIAGGIGESETNRRFTFNGSLFNDELMETANNNIFVAGQDDIDDEGDVWEWKTGSTVMQPGVGYAATHSEAFFILPPMATLPFQFDYTFEGPFNNGVIAVPINRNDATMLDNNWNLVGNPYPSAISAADFLTQNTFNASTNPSGILEGAIYLWSQNTAPSDTTNGNEYLNFSTSDYAVMNSMGGTKGGDTDRNADGSVDTNDDVIPYIASGQAFFVLFSDAQPSNSGDIVFNNAMRRRGVANSNLLFKTSNTKINNIDNKIWINLTSNNGVFNQILVGYAVNATDGNDGASYDAPKNTGTGTAAILYSNITDSNDKFAIQGKASNSLNMDEVISLGFKSNIGVATLFKLSIDHLQGDFLTNNTVYLKDNLLNKLHNLSDSDYTFTTEIGEYNERFEIVFNAENALSTDEVKLNTNKFSIVNLGNNNVKFNTNSNLSIKTVQVYDLLGRQLYDLKGNKNSETYSLPNLKTAIYIAKIELSNGVVITKKAIKK